MPELTLLEDLLSIDKMDLFVVLFFMVFFFSKITNNFQETKKKEVKESFVFIAFAIKKYQWLACVQSNLYMDKNTHTKEHKVKSHYKEIIYGSILNNLMSAIVTANYST